MDFQEYFSLCVGSLFCWFLLVLSLVKRDDQVDNELAEHCWIFYIDCTDWSAN
jgi:hypothetical protein